MKFCGKCYKMKVKKLTNPNNLTRLCDCDPNRGVLISKSAISRMRSLAPCGTARSNRRVVMRVMRTIDARGTVEA